MLDFEGLGFGALQGCEERHLGQRFGSLGLLVLLKPYLLFRNSWGRQNLRVLVHHFKKSIPYLRSKDHVVARLGPPLCSG